MTYLAVGYALVWLAIAAYLASIARRQRALERRLEQLELQARERPQARL